MSTVLVLYLRQYRRLPDVEFLPSNTVDALCSILGSRYRGRGGFHRCRCRCDRVGIRLKWERVLPGSTARQLLGPYAPSGYLEANAREYYSRHQGFDEVVRRCNDQRGSGEHDWRLHVAGRRPISLVLDKVLLNIGDHPVGCYRRSEI